MEVLETTRQKETTGFITTSFDGYRT